MSTSSKTLKRLGTAGAAALVGVVPLALTAGTADAAIAPGNPHLTLSSTTVGATGVTATDTFTTGAGVTTAESIFVTSTSTTGNRTAAYAVQLPTTTTDYSVTFTAPGSTTATPDPSTATVSTADNMATIAPSVAIPAGSMVTVTVSGAANPTAGSSVYFIDDTSADASPEATNIVSVGYATPVGVATVSSVNPYAFTTAAGEPFTVTGTFSTDATNLPIVCFVPSGSSAPSTAAACTGAAGTVATTTGNTGTEVQGTSPALGAGTYNVVVYNYAEATGTTPAGYEGPSATGAATLVSAVSGLNVVPEGGVRAVNSMTGVGAPVGAIPSGTALYLPLTDFAQSATVPTNVPLPGATALDLNVTAVAPSGNGNLQVYPTASSSANCSTDPTTGTPAPSTSTVNFQPTQDTSNSTLVDLTGGPSGICIMDNGASVNVDVDVTGYTLGGGFTAATGRVLDTMPTHETGGLQGPLKGNTTYRFDAAAAGLTPGTVVAMNVTDVAPTQAGNLRVFPETSDVTGTPVPQVSQLTYIPGVDASALMMTEVGADGYIDLYSNTGGTTNVIFDVVGTLPAGSSLVPVDSGTPFRILQKTGIASGQTLTVNASPTGSGSSFVPAGAVAVFGSLGDVLPATTGNLRTAPTGSAVPATSAINNYPGQARSTGALVALNPSLGQFNIYSDGSSTTLTFDAEGYIA